MSERIAVDFSDVAAPTSGLDAVSAPQAYARTARVLPNETEGFDDIGPPPPIALWDAIEAQLRGEGVIRP